MDPQPQYPHPPGNDDRIMQGRRKQFCIGPAERKCGGEAAVCHRAQSVRKLFRPIFSSQEALGWMELCRNRLSTDSSRLHLDQSPAAASLV